MTNTTSDKLYIIYFHNELWTYEKEAIGLCSDFNNFVDLSKKYLNKVISMHYKDYDIIEEEIISETWIRFIIKSSKDNDAWNYRHPVDMDFCLEECEINSFIDSEEENFGILS